MCNIARYGCQMNLRTLPSRHGDWRMENRSLIDKVGLGDPPTTRPSILSIRDPHGGEILRYGVTKGVTRQNGCSMRVTRGSRTTLPCKHNGCRRGIPSPSEVVAERRCAGSSHTCLKRAPSCLYPHTYRVSVQVVV